MQTSRLEAILDDHNRVILGECFDSYDATRVGVASAGDRPGEKRRSRSSNHSCCGGVIKGQPFSCRNLEGQITLRSAPPAAAVGNVAVGWVLDANGAAPEDDLDVVIAVGINYGQGVWYLGNPVLRTSPTGMRQRVIQADQLLVGSSPAGCNIRHLPRQFHLVAGNFFPWITTLAWSQYAFSGIEEALLLHCFGFAEPFRPLIRLLDPIAGAGGRVSHIVFHGANSAVPLLGSQFVQQSGQFLTRAFGSADVQVLFCDNLARPYLPVGNAVGLCLENTGSEAPDVMELDE